jgi:hypothetical protein
MIMKKIFMVIMLLTILNCIIPSNNALGWVCTGIACWCSTDVDDTQKCISEIRVRNHEFAQINSGGWSWNGYIFKIEGNYIKKYYRSFNGDELIDKQLCLLESGGTSMAVPGSNRKSFIKVYVPQWNSHIRLSTEQITWTGRTQYMVNVDGASYITGEGGAPAPTFINIYGDTSSGRNNMVQFVGKQQGNCVRGLATCTGAWWINPCNWTSYCSSGWAYHPDNYYHVNSCDCD